VAPGASGPPVKVMLLPLCEPRALHVPSRRTLSRPALLTVTLHDLAEGPVFWTRTEATYPCSQLAGTPTVTENAGGATVVFAGVGDAEVFSGTGECEVALGRAEVRDGVAEGEEDGEDDGERDNEGETEGDGATEDEDGAIGTCGIDGRATFGWTSASAGPTARTATQTTSMTSTAAAALRKMRAGPSGRAECLAGNGPPLR
jgi:hypothetical protein